MPRFVKEFLRIETRVEDGTCEGTISGELLIEGQPDVVHFAESYDACIGLPSEGFDAWCENNSVVPIVLP